MCLPRLMPPLHRDTNDLGVVQYGKKFGLDHTEPLGGKTAHGDPYSFLVFTPKSDAVRDTSKK